jgi:hypothetical protein
MKRLSIDDRQSTIGNSLDDVDLLSEKTSGGSPAEAALLEIATAPPASAPQGSPLADLPLQEEAAKSRLEIPSIDVEPAAVQAARAGVAPLRSRIAAFAADAAFILLLTAAPLLAATAGPARVLSPKGLWWTALFAVYLSFFATIVPLILFGKTVGMALTGLTARDGPEGPAPTAIESSRRWLGSLLAAAGLGIPLLVRRDPDFPSPADRLSGRSLTFEED